VSPPRAVDVRRSAAAQVDLDADTARSLVHDVDRRVRENLALNPSTPTDVLLVLLSDPHWRVRWEAAQNSSGGPAVHRAALAAEDTQLVWAVGQLGDALSAEVIELVLGHAVRSGREQLALVTRSPELLRRLAADVDHRVRRQVAVASACSPDLLRELAGDRRAPVRQAAAANPRLPPDAVDVLVLDRSADVRWNVLVHRRGRRDIAERLADDPDETVRNQARQHLGIPV
jgi:hypothetical protein